MVVVRCLILCSKFAKNLLSAVLRPDPLGSLQRSPRRALAGSWGNGRKGKWKGRRGRKGNGKEGAGRRDGKGAGGKGRGYI